jgi:hypothetical protein
MFCCFWVFSILNFPSAFRHSAKSLPECPKKVLDKEHFTDKIFAEYYLPSVTLDKDFAKYRMAFAESSANNPIQVVLVYHTVGSLTRIALFTMAM